jgi:hypothetical protein
MNVITIRLEKNVRNFSKKHQASLDLNSITNNFFRYLQLASRILEYLSGILAYTELSTGRIFKDLTKKQTEQV